MLSIACGVLTLKGVHATIMKRMYMLLSVLLIHFKCVLSMDTHNMNIA